ncbi:MAG: potassium channel family protein [Salibacteraceae bacterium]
MISSIRNTFILCFFLFTSLTLVGNEQVEKTYHDTMTLTEFWTTVMEDNGDSIVSLSHIFVTTKGEQEYKDIRNYLSKPKTVNHEIEVRDIYFEGYFHPYLNSYYSDGFTIDSVRFEKRVEISLENDQWILVHSCEFMKTVEIKTEGRTTSITDSKCHNGLWIFNMNNNNGKVRIENCQIENGPSHLWIVSHGHIYVYNTTFGSKNSNDSLWLEISGEMKTLNMENDTFNVPVVFGYNSTISQSLNIVECEFGKLSIDQVTLPENLSKTYLKWNQLKEHFVISNEFIVPDTVRGVGYIKFKRNFHSFITDSSITHTFYFDKLKNSANQLYAIYKTQGDIESANACYADIKEFETRRWKYLYQKDKSFETFFRWQLHSFLSYLSDYGTNPAKAVVKSWWVIFIFSIFYLFFPSDWDVSNKIELLTKIKSLTKKNRDKSIGSTLVFIVSSSFINFLNALTLSLNAFTTLGFGDIPTHGAARYITIIQGFIGWFMLTIFSVSLISQVLG